MGSSFIVSKVDQPEKTFLFIKRTFSLSNQVGTPRLVIDSASGKVAESLEFDEFGVLQKQEGKSLTPFGFAGGLYDADTGLVKFGARDYDAQVGRWTAKEPLRFDAGGTNLYSYSENDPVNLIDPTGLKPQCNTENFLSGLAVIHRFNQEIDVLQNKLADQQKLEGLTLRAIVAEMAKPAKSCEKGLLGELNKTLEQIKAQQQILKSNISEREQLKMKIENSLKGCIGAPTSIDTSR